MKRLTDIIGVVLVTASILVICAALLPVYVLLEIFGDAQ